MNVAIAGTGYVGLSLAVLLAQHHNVTAVDIQPAKIDLINRRRSPIADSEIESFFATRSLRLTATLDAEAAYRQADYIIVATPTNYDAEHNRFDTSSIEDVLNIVERVNPQAVVVIKSTVPVGFLLDVMTRHALPNILFSPEFLYVYLLTGSLPPDNLHPSRIIVGVPRGGSETLRRHAETFATLLQEGRKTKIFPSVSSTPQRRNPSSFSPTPIWLSVWRFFNELDTYAELHGLNTAQIIEGIGLDPRIGLHYNNPSFGYGGYLPAQGYQTAQSQFRRHA